MAKQSTAEKYLKSKRPKEAPAKDEVLESVLKDFDACWKYCEAAWHDRWTNSYKLYHNERVNIGYQGITDTFVPMPFSTVETLTSALFGSKPKFNFLPPKNKPDQKTEILNALVDHFWDKDQWSMKVINTGRSGLRTGVGVDYYAWQGDHPVLINVPIRDFIFDPAASSLENMRYMGRRYLTSKKELAEFEIVDIDKPMTYPAMDEQGTPLFDEMGLPATETTYNMKPKYKNLDKLEEKSRQINSTAKGSSQEKTDKQEKDLFYGSTAEDAEDQIEVIELWTEDRVVSIANRMVVIEDDENYYKAKARSNGEQFPKGIMPFACFRDYVDESLFIAKGEIDIIGDQAELLNDLTNQNIDAVTFVLNPMYTLDPKYGDKINTVENLPGAIYPFERNTLNRIDMGQVPADAFAERQNIKNEIRETTASNEVVKGVGEQAGGKSTATEINAQIAGAGQRINLKVTQIENEYFHRMARIMLAMIRLYVTEPMMVRIVGKDGARWEEFDPADFAEGEYEPRVQLDIVIQNQKQEQAAKAKEMLAAFMGDPEINQLELKKLALARGFQLDPDEVELLTTPPPMDPMMMGMDPAMGGSMPPEDMMLPPGQGGEYTDPVTGEVFPAEVMAL